jgi:hypothetical protein
MMLKRSIMKKSNFISHFAALMIVTVLCGLIYVTVQQSHRSGANDPQLQIALDLKNAIETNQSTLKWMPDDSIEISKSLSVFKTFYNENGEPVLSTGFLNGQLPKIPKTVLDFTERNQENVVTWQPQRGTRLAMVIESVKSPSIGFVAVGRSLKEVEKRESILVTMVVVAWLVCAGVILLHFLVSYFTTIK